MTNKKILIVDDEQSIRELLGKFLIRENFQIVYANNGLDALEKVRDETPDLIILDILLPLMNGYSVCRHLKYDSRYKYIKVIMLSAKRSIESQQIGMEIGADLYLTKPISGGELISQVKKLLGVDGKNE